MSGYLSRLVTRVLGNATQVAPLAPPLFGAGHARSDSEPAPTPLENDEPASATAQLSASAVARATQGGTHSVTSLPLAPAEQPRFADGDAGVDRAPAQTSNARPSSSLDPAIPEPASKRSANESLRLATVSASAAAAATHPDTRAAQAPHMLRKPELVPVPPSAPRDPGKQTSPDSVGRVYAQLRSMRESTPAPAPPVVRITIGRVEVRSVQPSQPPLVERPAPLAHKEDDALAKFLGRNTGSVR